MEVEVFEYKNIIVRPLSLKVLQNGSSIPFATMESNVLYFPISNPNIAFAKEQIYEAMMRENYTDSVYVIRDIIYRVRSRFFSQFAQNTN